MDPKDLRKQLEETVNPVIDQRLEGKPAPRPAAPAPAEQPAPEAPAQTSPVPQAEPAVPAPAQSPLAQTPADVAPSAPSAGAPTQTKGISINVAGNSLRSVDMDQVEIDQIVYDAIQSISEKTNITEIRSGGQSGVDEAAIKAAVELGIPAKVLAPKGWLFLDKTGYKAGEKEFKARFGDLVDRIEFVEHTVGDTPAVAYTSRTKENANASDVTINFAEPEKDGTYSRGELATRKWAQSSGKTYVETSLTQPDLGKIQASIESATSRAIGQGVVQTPPPGETPASVAPTAISGESGMAPKAGELPPPGPVDPALEKMTTAATPDLGADLAATQTGELRAAPSAEAQQRVSRAARLQREQEILGYDPIADLKQGRDKFSAKKMAIQVKMIEDISAYLKQTGEYTTTTMQRIVQGIKDSDIVYDTETDTYEVKGTSELDIELKAMLKKRGEALTEFLNTPHGLERKVYGLYTKRIFGTSSKGGRKVSAIDSEADPSAINRGRRAIRRMALHFLMNRIQPGQQQEWQALRDEFRKMIVDAGVPEEAFDAAMSEPLYGGKDQRSFVNDGKRIDGHVNNVRAIAGELLKSGQLSSVMNHPDVAQAMYYLLSEITQSDAELLSGDMANTNVFAEEEYMRSVADDLTEVQDEIQKLRDKGIVPIEESPNARIGRTSNGATFTLVDYKNYLRGGQRRYALDIAGAIDPRWVEVDSKGLDLPIFANDNHPDAMSQATSSQDGGSVYAPTGTGSTKASIGFNIGTDPTATIATDPKLQRISTLEIRINKAIKRYLIERDAAGLIRPGTDDKTIRFGSDMPYTQDRFQVEAMARRLRGIVDAGRIVIVAFPQFDSNGKKIEYNPGDVVVIDGRVFPREPSEMIALNENDPAVAKLIDPSVGASATKPFKFGDSVEYPAGQVKPGQFNMFVVDVDPVVHQAVQHTLPLRTVGGLEFEGAYVPEPFADEFGGTTQVVAEQGVRTKQSGTVQEVVTTEGRKLVGTTTEQPIRTLIVADDSGAFPTVGTMIDQYVYGDPYGEDPQMYAEIADRTGPHTKDLVAQQRRYEELVNSGTPRDQLPEPNPENATALQENIIPPKPTGGAAASQLAAAQGAYDAQVAEYDRYLALKKYVEDSPSDTVKAEQFRRQYPDGMKEPKAPVPDKFRDILEGPKVQVYDATDVYDRNARKTVVRKKGSEAIGTLTDMPPIRSEPLTPDQQKSVASMFRSLLVILRHRAQTSNFIGNAGEFNSSTANIQATADRLKKLFDHADANGLYNAYFDSILQSDVLSKGLGLSDPNMGMWIQRLVELPAQRPLSTRGRDTGRFIQRTALTGDPEFDSFSRAVDGLYEAVANFHAKNPVRNLGSISLDSTVTNPAAADDGTIAPEDQVTLDETIAQEAGNTVSQEPALTEAEKVYASRNGLTVADNPGSISVLRAIMKYDSDVRTAATVGIGGKPAQKLRTSEVRAKMIRLVELLKKANLAKPGTYTPGVGVYGKPTDKTMGLRPSHDPSTDIAVKSAMKDVLALPEADRAKAVDAAFEKYSQHLADDMDGDALVKVINSMLYGDDSEDSLAKAIDDMKYMDVTKAIGSDEKPILYGNETARILTKEELLSLDKVNGSEVRRLSEFAAKRGYDIIAAKNEDGIRILLTKVKKNKYGKLSIAPEEDFTKRNLFTADEVNRALSNFGASNLIRVIDTGVKDGRTALYTVEMQPSALTLLGDIPTAGDPKTKQYTSNLRKLLDSALKSEFRRIASEESIRSGGSAIFTPAELDPIQTYRTMLTDRSYGPFGRRRIKHSEETNIWYALRRGGTDAAERLKMLSEYAAKTKPGADPILDALRETGNAPAYHPLDAETEGLSRRFRTMSRNHKMGLVAGGGMLGAILMGVGVDAAMNKAQYGDQAAADALPMSVAMNAAFEANPALGAALALSHSAVNKQDMARTLVNILGSIAGGAAGGTLGAFGGPVGAFAAGTAGSMAGATIADSLYGAVTGQGDGNSQPLPANVAVDQGNSTGAASIASVQGAMAQMPGSAIDQINKLKSIGG